MPPFIYQYARNNSVAHQSNFQISESKVPRMNCQGEDKRQRRKIVAEGTRSMHSRNMKPPISKGPIKKNLGNHHNKSTASEYLQIVDALHLPREKRIKTSK